VEPSGRNGDEIQLFVPRGTAFRALPQPEASIFPLLEVDDLDQAYVDPVRSRIEISGEPESDGAWTWLKVRAPGGNVHSRARRPGTASAACHPTPGYTVPDMDWKIELVAIPVTDVDRAKAFYVEQAGFHADHDYQVSDVLRFVQLTPPGSACSIVLGTGVTQMPPGSQKGVQCVVADVEAARRELIAHDVQTSDVDVQPWGSFVTFSDPDGNTWALQQVPQR
jgi:catechol 2,3-dioxygenase-like lactoylglutathione lyase family enzyme